MPLTTTHALLPLAAAVGFGKKPLPGRLTVAAAIAAAFPDIDWLAHAIWSKPPLGTAAPIYWHRGGAHSLFLALAAGIIAAAVHRALKVDRLTAGLAIGAAMASHGLLDMLTDYGQPVAYLWPLSSKRLFADWRPIHTGPIPPGDFLHYVLVRQQLEIWQLILPMFALAFVVRMTRASFKKYWGVRS